MTLNEILSNETETIDEAIHTLPSDYERYWHHFTPEEKEAYTKEGHVPKSGLWIYKHREAMGLDYHDKRVVHHKDHDKHNNSKNNLQIVSRKEHAIIDPNALKHKGELCKECKKRPFYANHLCYKCYMKHYMRKWKKKN